MTDALTAGTQSSQPVTSCQICGSTKLESQLFLGYLPPVNTMHPIGSVLSEQPAYPAELMHCANCDLTQLGLIVDPEILFPPDYPYTSGTTKILHENFAEMAQEATELLGLTSNNLIVDIGSNDGTLLSKYKDLGYPVHGIEPTDAYKLAIAADIPTTNDFFNLDVAKRVVAEVGHARVITACNCFAHIENVGNIVDGILEFIGDDGVFISESHYLISLLETLQYDTIYHEHLRYYSLKSISYLLESKGLEVFHAKRIPTHGGSIRVYAARKGTQTIRSSVQEMIAAEDARGPMRDQLAAFRDQVVNSKLELNKLLAEIKQDGSRIFGISAPSRGSTLFNYCGMDDQIIDCIVEIKGSKKIGKYLPGTLIPVEDEARLFNEQPEYALLLAWHIADDLIPKLKKFGYEGKFIVPLPTPRIV